MTLVDTSVLVDVLRGRPAATSWWEATDDPQASEVTRVEVLQGMRSSERLVTYELLAEVRWHPVDTAVAERAGELGRSFRRSHGGIDVADLCIAATAQLRALEPATLNVRHFPMFAGLRPPY